MSGLLLGACPSNHLLRFPVARESAVDNGFMAKIFRRYEPDQLLLMPPKLVGVGAGGSLARFVGDLVDETGLSAIEESLRGGARVSALPPADDGEGAGVRLLPRGVFLASDRSEVIPTAWRFGSWRQATSRTFGR